MTNVLVASEREDCDLWLVPGKNFTNGTTAFKSYFGSISSLELDLLNLSSSIFVTDLAVKRSSALQYARDISIQVEVVNIHAFEHVRGAIEAALFKLSRDNWSFQFLPKAGHTESANKSMPDKGGITLLFSGGVDSFCAAASLYASKRPLALVSHVTHNRTVEESQKDLHKSLSDFYKRSVDHYSLRVFGRNHQEFTFPSDTERENSQRTRSFLFLSIAALVARRTGHSRIVMMAENGQFAIHLPLTPARVGPFSTHTADPSFIRQMQEILRILLNYGQLVIENPLLYKTKGEVVDTLDPKLYYALQNTISCWMSSRVKTHKHCGICIPCLSRRIALESRGIVLKEYKRDPLREDIESLPPEDDGKRNLSDLLSFVLSFDGDVSKRRIELLDEFPDLHNQAIDQDKAIKMYGRFSREAKRVLSNYPNVAALMK